MNKLQTVLDALEKIACLGNGDKHGNSVGNVLAIEAIGIVKEMMAQEPVAWMSPGKECLEFSRKDTVYGSHTVPLYAAPVAVQAVPAVTDEMVNRFLCWKLPRGFYPDGGITFSMKGRYEGFPLPDCWPIGKNLLTADQAREMLEHVIAAAPVAKVEM